MLKTAVYESISTSPGVFLMTADDLDGKEPDYWEGEICSSTWAVIQRGDEFVGLAVARWPDAEMDSDVDPAVARFIESVWIAPEFRGKRLAERLVRFLFEVECAKSPGIRQFLLWVFDKNQQAIRSYERMGFRYVARQDLADRTELRYEYWREPDAGEVQAALAARQDDLRASGLVYRVLGKETG
jgi:ribosomal protein S18 acetylase RimI-like enzyme